MAPRVVSCVIGLPFPLFANLTTCLHAHPQLVTRHPCACSVEDFWGLRDDDEWDQFNAELDGQIFTTMHKEVVVEDGFEKVVRNHKLKAKVNPFPKPMRHMLGADEFVVRVQAHWFRLKYEEKDAMFLAVQPPVFSERIKINGWQWAERIDDHNCMLCTKMEISCKIPGPGISTQVEKGTEKGMKGAYADQPRRVMEYLAQRKRSGRDYNDPFRDARLAKQADAKQAAAPEKKPAAAAAAQAQAPPRPTAAASSSSPLATQNGAVAAAPAREAPNPPPPPPPPSFNPPPFSSPLATIEPQKRPTPPTGQAAGGAPLAMPPLQAAAYAAAASGTSTARGSMPPMPRGVSGAYDVLSPGGASLVGLRQTIASQRAALAKAEEELSEMVRAEEARLASELHAARAQLEHLHGEIGHERALSAALQQRLEASENSVRAERQRANDLGEALATAMQQLKDPAGPELEEMVAMAEAALAKASVPVLDAMPPPQPTGNGNGGAHPPPPAGLPPPPASMQRISTAERMSTAAGLSGGLPSDASTMMGDLYDDDDDDDGAAAGSRAKPTPDAGPTLPQGSGAPSPQDKKSSSAEFDPLVRMLHGLEGGRYRSEELHSHVGLAGSLLLATDQRLIYIRKGTGELHWQVPFASLASADQPPGTSSVVLKLAVEPVEWEGTSAPPTRSIDCMTPAVVPLVLDTVRRALDQQAAHLVEAHLDT